MQIHVGQRQVFYNEENHAIRAVLANQGIALLSKVAIAHYLQMGMLKIVSKHHVEALNYYLLSALNQDEVMIGTKKWCREKLEQVYKNI